MDHGKKRRKKTFTGCWTCRSRRVKCDEQTPSCQRCRLLGVECEGYGVRLTWLTSQDERHFSPDIEDAVRTRRNMRVFDHSKASLTPKWSELEVDAMLSRIDECPTDSSRTECGVFSVFPYDPPLSRPSVVGISVEVGLGTNTVSNSAGLQPDASLPPTSITPSQFDLPESSVGSPNDSGLVALADINVPSGRVAFNSESERLSVGGPNDLGNAATSGLDQASAYTAQPTAPRPSRHLELLQMPSSEKRLIHHWITYTSGKLVLVDEPHNPCRSMMLPMALAGLMSDSNESTADVAVFHAICAGAAYNLFELSGRSCEEDRALAWRHDELAIHHLRHNLVQADQHRTQSLGMAIMACITIEAISGNTSRWRTHVDGALAYLTELRKTAIGLEVSLAFQIHLVPMAIFCGYQVPIELKTFLQDGAEKLELSFPYYGISQSFLSHLDYINASTVSSNNSPTRTELDALELQLYLDFPSSSSDGQSKTHASIMYYMTQAFYYALLVYYQRSVQHASITTVQTLVDKGVTQLEAIETETKGMAGSVMMWAPLVLSAECNTPDLQRRIRTWFTTKRRLGFRNITVIEEMIYCLWEKRACGNQSITWQDLIVEDRFDVFRL